MTILLTILLIFSYPTITIIDYGSDTSISGVYVYYNGNKIEESDDNGQIQIDLDHISDLDTIRLQYLGFHDIVIDGKNLKEIDKVYLFECKHIFKEPGYKFKKSKYIKRNKIEFSRNGKNYLYQYDPSSHDLSLSVNAH